MENEGCEILHGRGCEELDWKDWKEASRQQGRRPS